MRSSLTSCRWSWLWLDDGGDVASSLHPSSPGCGSSGCSCCHRSLVSGRPCRQGSTHSPWHDQVGNKKELNPDVQDDRRVDRQGFRLFLSLILSFFFFLSIHVSFLSHFLTFPLPLQLIPASHPFLYSPFDFLLPFAPSSSNAPFLLPHFLRLTPLQPHFLREDCSVQQTVRWLHLHILWSEFVCRPAATS